MVRAGLGQEWSCLFANDNDEKKAASYQANWGKRCLKVDNVESLTTSDLPGRPDLAWASFPCQDLSLAGDYAGLKGARSGTFWPFWRLIQSLVAEGRSIPIVALENVCGALTSHGGKDFAAIGSAFTGTGYRFGALVIDANHFVPQSRPRLFFIGVLRGVELPSSLVREEPDSIWHPPNLRTAQAKLSPESKEGWLWWNLPAPPRRESTFADVIDDNPEGVDWHTPGETRRLLSLMNMLHRRKVEKAKRLGRRIVGGIYKRTRPDGTGKRIQRAEIRFDGVAGCLRTPGGGSSRQSILLVEGDEVHSRLLSPREAARLMGLPETYILPQTYNDAYHLAGDGVVVPAVRFLAANLLEPIVAAEAAVAHAGTVVREVVTFPSTTEV